MDDIRHMAPPLLEYASLSCHYGGLFVDFSDARSIAPELNLSNDTSLRANLTGTVLWQQQAHAIFGPSTVLGILDSFPLG